MNLDLQLREQVLAKFRKNGFATFSESEIEAIEGRVALCPSDPLAHLYRSFVLWNQGKEIESSISLQQSRELIASSRDALVGIEIGVNSWMPDLYDAEFLGDSDDNSLFSLIRESSNVNASMTILMCADDAYFQKFKSAILASAANTYRDCVVHLHLLNPSEQSIEFLQGFNCAALSVSTELLDDARSHKAFYASSRFLIGRKVMDHYDTHLLTTDVDVFPSAQFHSILKEIILSGLDLSCGRKFKSWMPWNTHIVTKCFFRNNDRGREVLQLMSSYIRFVANRVGSYKDLWWIDQNAMHFAVECQKGQGLSFRPIASFGQMFVGPEKIGKDAFAAITSDFFGSSDLLEPAKDDAMPSFLSRYGKELLKDDALTRSLLTLSLSPNEHSNSRNWMHFLLPFHLLGALAPSALDDLMACAVRAGNFSLAAACVLPGKQAKNVLFDLPPNDDSGSRDQAIEILTPLVARYKKFAALNQLSKQYGSNDSSTFQHFRAGEVRQLLSQGLVFQAREAMHKYFKTGILVGGIQRSGTNYLSEILRQDESIFTTYSDDNDLLFWKHALPREVQKNRCNSKFKSPVDALKFMGLQCIILYKTPINWLDSIINRFPADFFETRPAHVSHAEDYAGMINFYAFYLNSWRQASLESDGVNITLMSYERLMESPGIELRRVPGIGDAVSLDQTLDIAYSRGFAKRASSENETASPQLPDEALKEVDAVLRSRLTWMLNDPSLKV